MAGRTDPPRLVTGGFVALGDGARDQLVGFGVDYLRVFGELLARQLADDLKLHHEAALAEVLQMAQRFGYDEFVVAPATSDPALIGRLAEIVGEVVAG